MSAAAAVSAAIAPSLAEPSAHYPHGISVENVDTAGRILNDASKPLAERFRSLFVLRNLKCDRSVSWIGAALDDTSALLKHELAYCLGQMQNRSALPVLIRTLENTQQEPMVRHEAAEALGAIGDPSAIRTLRAYIGDPCVEVAETCDLALQRLECLVNATLSVASSSAYDSVDPAPPAECQSVADLGDTLIDETRSLWERYKAMFALRDLNTPDSINALNKGLFCEGSALFRHEVAYVLGQVQSPLSINALTKRLVMADESSMVRHECAEALGAIATPECESLLQAYAKDTDRVVRESCEVALDMTEHEKSAAFQYATLGGK